MGRREKLIVAVLVLWAVTATIGLWLVARPIAEWFSSGG